MLRFSFDEKKALETLVYVTNQWPSVSAFYAAKVFFFAERQHLSDFGRPIVGDRYIAMDNGPVPSAVYDWFKGKLDRFENPDDILAAISFVDFGRYTGARANRAPDLDYLSPTDIAALDEAIRHCRGREFGDLSQETHRDAAWVAAGLNMEMDPRLMIQGERRDEVIEAAEEFASYGLV